MSNDTPGESPSESAFVPAQEEEALDYFTVLNEAIELSKKIRYIRTPEDTDVYEKTMKSFYLASKINPSADWPLLRICAIETLWRNDYNQRVLDAATEALRRRETLEGFIYCCRAHLRNKESKGAHEAISDLMLSVKDAQVANVGNIFKSIVIYELGDYSAYADLIDTFRKAKSSEFNPHISIPVDTVYTETSFAPSDFRLEQVSVNGRPLTIAKFPASDCRYVISISCDQKYFDLYGKYIVKSFSKNCSHESILHITFLDGDSSTYRPLIDSWGGKNVEFVVADICTEVNKGPVASLLRFMNVSALLEECSLPVLVLDLDTVIKKSFVDLVTMMQSEGVDILSRVLERGMAPWEKYTGGFAFFSNSENARRVARNIAYIGTKICRTDVTQWWIDQNIFEAGIRENLRRGGGLHVKNIFNIRDQYCVMPVGSADSKTFLLENALSMHS